jgi:hypothetical protein
MWHILPLKFFTDFIAILFPPHHTIGYSKYNIAILFRHRRAIGRRDDQNSSKMATI